MKMHLQALADDVRRLLNCDQVSLFLYCPPSVVCHPLLSLFCELYKRSSLCYSSVYDPTFLYDEHLWTICDIALQSEQDIIDNLQLRCMGVEVSGSITVALLERPAGIIGFLLCTAQQENAFMEGERHLLAQYLPMLAYQVELILSESCSALPESAATENRSRETQEQHVFLSLIGHELRAPLMAIKGYAGLLQEYGLNGNRHVKMSRVQQQRYLNTIMEQIKHLEILIGDMIDISHIQSGRLTLHCTSIDLTELCQHVVQLVRIRIEQQQPGHYRILCTIDANVPRVWADADRVQQILTNLLENALKYSPAGGVIEVNVSLAESCSLTCSCIQPEQHHYSLEDAHTFVCITVSDHGIGIPSQQQASLFKPFVRLTHPITRHVTGNGLGLYIVRKLVEAMHGRIVLRSNEGEGTSITCMLPTAPTPIRSTDEVNLIGFQK